MGQAKSTRYEGQNGHLYKIKKYISPGFCNESALQYVYIEFELQAQNQLPLVKSVKNPNIFWMLK